MWATCPRSASSGYHAEFHEGYYQKYTNLLNCRASIRILPATTRTFTKDMALSDNGRGTTWYCELARHGMAGNGVGTAWAWHFMCELAFRV
jgi:hypothetical protein